MKAIMLSVQPQWVAKILNGEKTIEIRKSVPKDFMGWVYIYCSKEKKYGDILVKWDNDIHELYSKTPKYEMTNYSIKGIHNMGLNGKVVARFWFDETITYTMEETNGLYSDNDEYNIGYDELEETCLDYWQLCHYGKGKPLYAWHIKKLEILDRPKELSEFEVRSTGLYRYVNYKKEYLLIPLEIAPQSWCYVEVKEGK